jgi:hypothetical protein
VERLGAAAVRRYARRVRRLSDPTRRRLLASACALCLAAVPMLTGASVPAASAAGFEGGALNKLTEGQEAETSTTSTAANTTKSESTGTSQSILFIVVGTAVVLLAGVAFVIMRDARRVAPATDVEFAQGGGSARRSEEALRRRRAKAKAARQQRKRNR